MRKDRLLCIVQLNKQDYNIYGNERGNDIDNRCEGGRRHSHGIRNGGKGGTESALAFGKYYSGVLGVELGIRQTLKLLNAQAAFFLTVFPVDCPLALRAACLAWLVAALGGCRRLGLKVEE